MKALLAILAMALLLTSCTTTKHTTSTMVAVHDTLIQQVHDTTTRDKVVTLHERIHDTVITTPGYDISQTFTADQLTASHTANGKAVPHSFHKDKGNLHEDINVDTAGNVTVDCHDDSLKAVIDNLVEISRDQSDSIAHLTRSATTESDHAAASTYDKIVKTQWPWWLKVVIGLVLMTIVIQIVYKLLKFFKFIP